MNVIQITPGAGKMFCGNCFRDNALVAALRGKGHEVLMVPLYLPLTLDGRISLLVHRSFLMASMSTLAKAHRFTVARRVGLDESSALNAC